MISEFDLKDVNRSASSINPKKLLWLNQCYLRNRDNEMLVSMLEDFFNDMKISPGTMLGNVTDGLKMFLKTLTSGRISIGALAVGTAIGAYKKALQYATERKAFGKSIYKFQSIGFNWLIWLRKLRQQN